MQFSLDPFNKPVSGMLPQTLPFTPETVVMDTLSFSL